MEVTVKDSPGIHLYGYTYRGTPQQEELRATFQKVENLISDSPGAVMHTIYQIEPAGKRDTMQVFVGTDRLIERPKKEMEERVIASEQVILAKIQVNRWVMPRPEKVKTALEAFAAENGLETQGMYIDRLIAPDHVEVIAPLKP